jgi:hypothetical protein
MGAGTAVALNTMERRQVEDKFLNISVLVKKNKP